MHHDCLHRRLFGLSTDDARPKADKTSGEKLTLFHKDRRESSYFIRSAAVGGPSTQLVSHAPSTVMNVSEFVGNQASWVIFAGMKLNPPGLSSNFLPSHASVAVPTIIVCDSLAVCQCLRT